MHARTLAGLALVAVACSSSPTESADSAYLGAWASNQGPAGYSQISLFLETDLNADRSSSALQGTLAIVSADTTVRPSILAQFVALVPTDTGLTFELEGAQLTSVLIGGPGCKTVLGTRPVTSATCSLLGTITVSTTRPNNQSMSASISLDSIRSSITGAGVAAPFSGSATITLLPALTMSASR